MVILTWIVAGISVGYWALWTMRGTRGYGLPLALGLAVGGAISGGYLAELLQLTADGNGLMGTMVALTGAVTVMIAYHKMT
ncbi:GlsB/YeaQ/YmgE family stress response membrane protein [Ferrimonas sediminicola]|uniref:GlsB/YeaQ/YmgE family stress response membrane protein n=1 Tax=Ferrimonas sediminicola TaxID=2569538 RepID=A0A4U1BCB3_9GAMM|nr:GlsB/YeaQ/YmgE family stress response membrane protein [Ferrimonas sediminicola]TKB48606.1 GlsB/YeaQ/YmgE family stress response membrane protein [Ferrimonas sediminicola]